MKRVSFVALAILVTAVACSKKSTENGGGGGGGTTPTPVVTTSTQTFTVPLVAAAEVPAIAGAEANASGTATIKFNLTKTDNALTGATVDFSVNVAGVTSNVTLAHIHTGAVGSNGGIVVNTGVASGDVPLAGGTGSFTKNGISNFTVDVANSILNNPSAFYFNVHTSSNPGGVMRGQLNGVTGVGSTGGVGGTGGTGGAGGETGGAGGGPVYVDPYAQ